MKLKPYNDRRCHSWFRKYILACILYEKAKNKLGYRCAYNMPWSEEDDDECNKSGKRGSV